jgi:hypothetical protein
MNNSPKPRKLGRLRSLFKKREQSPNSSPDVQLVQPPSQNASDSVTYGDRARAKARHIDAVKLLEEAMKECGDQWKIFDFPEMRGEPEDFKDAQFSDKMNTVLAKHRDKVKNWNAWGKLEYGIQRVFATFTPFAKNFLIIAKEGQSVMSPCPVHTDSE